ncbi:MAG: hypothetical protein LRZ85_00045 [Alphaproteobacteria bacterium]|nr:hypothetical protein [Alphaproteobacteria bacterium]MCD8526562.1 hypothetical protein [Alphaproteobacteria bacterium]MCD8571324.1 hypothetical protein [Alphaproteobacteria bacterium]
MARKKVTKNNAKAKKTANPAPAFHMATDPARASEIRLDFAGGALILPLHPGKTTWAELEASIKDWLSTGFTGDKVSMRYIAGSYGGNIALTMSRPSGAHYAAADVIGFLREFGRKEMPEFYYPPSEGRKTRNPKRSADAALDLDA